MTLQPDNQHPVESTGITEGAGIPGPDLDKLITATIPVDSRPYSNCDLLNRAAAHPPRPDLMDIGPATPPPAWCLPGREPVWGNLAAEHGGGQICMWDRNLDGPDLWISCEDTVLDGRVLRSPPRIFGTEEPEDGWTAEQARELAANLIAAADLIDGVAPR